jgi:DivIVA domain-containing protein
MTTDQSAPPSGERGLSPADLHNVRFTRGTMLRPGYVDSEVDRVLSRVAEELSHVLAAKWSTATDRSVFDRASLVVQGWYQIGVPLGWWDSGRGPADRRPNAFGRAAAGAVLRAVANGRTRGP